MNAETILHSDVLDILFENRNKHYGAYELRKNYNKRLLISVGTMLSLVMAWMLFSFFKQPDKPKPLEYVVDFPIADSLQLRKIAEEPKEAPKPQAARPKVATVKNPTPVIVPDKLVDKTEVPETDDLKDKLIGIEDIEGPPPGDIVQGTPMKGNGVGTGTTPQPEVIPEPAVVERAEVMPEYPGGIDALRRFLGRHLQVPEDAVEAGGKVKVPIKFVVNKDGLLSDVEFLVPVDDVFKKEILRVVGKMPKWKPGSQHGRTVAVYFSIPIVFEVSE